VKWAEDHWWVLLGLGLAGMWVYEQFFSPNIFGPQSNAVKQDAVKKAMDDAMGVTM
jgi:hypothetical protein